jgi:hypothetical protein
MTSVVAVIIIFFLMLIYVLVILLFFSLNDNIDNSGGRGLSNEKLDSEILLDIFLKDKIEIDDGERNVRSVVVEMYKGSGNLKLMNAIQDRFHDVYSCGGRNKLVVLYYWFSGGESYIQKYIDYPDTYPDLKLPEKINDFGPKYSAICDIKKNSKNGYAVSVDSDHNQNEGWSYDYCVFVEENVIC